MSQKDNEITSDMDDSVALPSEANVKQHDSLDKNSSGGPFGRLSQFIDDVRAELKRVSWPTANEVKGTTLITLITVIFFSVYLFAVDQAIVQIGRFLNWLLSLVGVA